MSTVHPRKDNRIFWRECLTLQQAGYDVHFVVADGLGSESAHGVTFHDVGKASSRLRRIASLPSRARKKVTELAPDLVHIHDPELLPMAVSLRMRGFKVLYDAHEDLPRSLNSRDWVPASIRPVLAWLVERVEVFCASRLAGVVTATEVIAARFDGRAASVSVIFNYPRLENVPPQPAKPAEDRTFCYVGAISRDRGIYQMLEAIGLVGGRLLLAGPFEGAQQEAELRALPQWKHVDYRGVVPHAQVWDIMQRSIAGLLFLRPVQNYIDSLPTKLFEYMAAGIPTLASDYAGWPDIITENAVGLTCDPADSSAIAALMRKLIDEPRLAKEMGDRAREVVIARFRWENEGEKLADFYRKLLA